MKLIAKMLLILFLFVTMIGCRANTDANEPISSEESVPTQENDLEDEAALFECAASALREIGIEDAEMKVVSDTKVDVLRDVKLEVTQNGIPLTIGCFEVYGKWYANDIFNKDTKLFYWAADDVRKYVDIYDWQTGELISEKTEELPQ